MSHTNTHHTTTQHIATTTPHGDRERDRDRQRQRKQTGTRGGEKTEEVRKDKRREDKRRQNKRREDKRRQDKTREESRFIFRVVVHARFFVGVVICLVNPVCARDLSLLNSVKYD